MSHKIVWEHFGLYRKFTDGISGHELVKIKLDLSHKERFKEIKYIINDFLEISEHSIEIEHANVFTRMNEVMSNTKHELKIAMVVVDDKLIGFAERYCALMQDQVFECAFFHSVEEARAWVETTR